MSSASSAGVAFAAVAVIQSGLAVWLDRAPISGATFRKVVFDGTKNYDIDGIKCFFHDEEYGAARVDAIVRIGSLASRTTIQLAALIEAIVGLAVVAVVAFADNHGLGWKIPAVGLLVLALILLGMLGNRIRKGALRDFRLKRPSRKGTFDTPGPYLAMVVAAAIFTAIAVLAEA